MKNFKILTFVPLGVAISSLFLYIYNIIFYRLSRLPVTDDVQRALKTYVIIFILGFLIFIIIKGLSIFLYSRKAVNLYNMEEDFSDLEKKLTKEVIRCKRCNYVIDKYDNYCRNCGIALNRIINKDRIKNIINLIEIIILILVLYLLLIFMFEYKAKIDSNFKVPIYFRLLK